MHSALREYSILPVLRYNTKRCWYLVKESVKALHNRKRIVHQCYALSSFPNRSLNHYRQAKHNDIQIQI